ncbi:ABC transporter ATP-binding protein [Sorangium sp. So ce1151]|uniref:ABC transporter ATP-binding protein n=1 Tax=Sorangium sp. So ce1151 TaxID=3133332 RepID=UPI003F617B50
MSVPDRRRNGARVLLERLEKRFDDKPVLSGIELDVRPGELLTIVGRSGSGKSTLLRILCGLEQPTGGAARILTPEGIAGGAAVRVVFQEPRLMPWRTVLQNVCIGLPKERRERARDVLARVGLLDRQDDYPGVLSGGQRQRVALARALVHDPKVLLLDEPFGALDALTRIGAQRLVESLWAQHGFTAILVTHDVQEAVLLGDRVLVFDEGRVVESVAVDLPRPRAREVPEVGRLTGALLEAIFASGDGPSTRPPPARDLPAARDVTPPGRRRVRASQEQALARRPPISPRSRPG